jgi:hypothetical protein
MARGRPGPKPARWTVSLVLCLLAGLAARGLCDGLPLPPPLAEVKRLARAAGLFPGESARSCGPGAARGAGRPREAGGPGAAPGAALPSACAAPPPMAPAPGPRFARRAGEALDAGTLTSLTAATPGDGGDVPDTPAAAPGGFVWVSPGGLLQVVNPTTAQPFLVHQSLQRTDCVVFMVITGQGSARLGRGQTACAAASAAGATRPHRRPHRPGRPPRSPGTTRRCPRCRC